MLSFSFARAIAVVFPFVAMSAPSGSGAPVKPVDSCFRSLPKDVQIVESIVVSRDQTAAIGEKLGGKIRKISNTTLTIEGLSFKVNILDAATAADAEKLHQSISRMKGHPAACLRQDRRVIEFSGTGLDPGRMEWTAALLGFVSKEIRYRVNAQVALVDESHYMSFNELCNQFTTLKNNPGDPATTARIHELAGRFRFGDSLTLRTAGHAKNPSSFRFIPDAASGKTDSGGECRTLFFADPPKKLGVPYVSMNAEISSFFDGLTPSTRKADPFLTAATPFWPVDDSEIITLASEITAGADSIEEKAGALLRWLKPNTNIQSGGPVQGSRWGVKKVLEQRFGHCWDSSDLFITLARSVDVPCRQVGGWLYGTSGHIWAEILLEGKGWLQVDPTSGSTLPCGTRHIPWFTSEDGNMPILYVGFPVIEIVKSD